MTTYRGYTIIATVDDFIVYAPNGDTTRCWSMSAVRRWVSGHIREHAEAA